MLNIRETSDRGEQGICNPCMHACRWHFSKRRGRACRPIEARASWPDGCYCFECKTSCITVIESHFDRLLLTAARHNTACAVVHVGSYFDKLLGHHGAPWEVTGDPGMSRGYLGSHGGPWDVMGPLSAQMPVMTFIGMPCKDSTAT